MGKIIGIDLGTTNSCVAVLDGVLLKTQRVIVLPLLSLRIPMMKSSLVNLQSVRP
jgi:molecular chaperone DnaK (HSP70)